MSFTTLDDFLARASDRLDPIQGSQSLSEVGDIDFVDEDHRRNIRAAAVLIPVIPRKDGPTALLTQRPDTMAAHPGQVAFPGGKVDQVDVDDVAAAELNPVLRDLTIPTLIMHSTTDTIVGIDNADLLFAATAHPKSFVALDGADHLLSDPDHADHAAEVLAAWVDPLLPARPEPSDDVLVPADEGAVVVAERGTGTFAQIVRVAERPSADGDLYLLAAEFRGGRGLGDLGKSSKSVARVGDGGQLCDHCSGGLVVPCGQ